MAKHPDKPISFKERVQRAIPGAASPEMRDALAKLAPPEKKQAVAKMAERFQQPFQGEQDPPAAAPEPSTPKPSTPEPSTTTSTPAPLQTSRPRRGEQSERTKRVLRNRVYPPEGKVPRGLTDKTVTEKVATALAAEREEGLAPENEDGWPDPSDDVVGRVVKKLGRSG